MWATECHVPFIDVAAEECNLADLHINPEPSTTPRGGIMSVDDHCPLLPHKDTFRGNFAAT